MKIVLLLCGLIGAALACGSGGGSPPPVAAVPARCDFYRGIARVTCTVGSDSKTCDVERPYVADETQTGGPTPLGTYLLGKMGTYKGVDWCKLHPLINGRYWHAGYRAPGETRSGFGLHEGQVSEGCITVSSDSCWSGLKAVLDKAQVSRERVESGSGPNDHFDTSTIGKVYVHA